MCTDSLNPTHCKNELGGVVGEGCGLLLKCANKGEVISGIRFAEFGRPVWSGNSSTGKKVTCASFATNSTAAPSCLASDPARDAQIVAGLCVGKTECELLASTGVFGEPCRGVHKRLAVWATGCTPDQNPGLDPQYTTLPSTIAGASSVAWEAVEYGSGPLPHTRYVGGGSHDQGYWKVSANLSDSRGGGAAIRVGYGKVIDDDGIGGVRMVDGDAFCLDAVRGGNLETWWAPLSGGRHALALFNRSPSPDNITVQLSGLNTLSNRSTAMAPAAQVRVRVRDVWRRADLGEFSGSFTSSVPAHGTHLYILSPVATDHRLWAPL